MTSASKPVFIVGSPRSGTTWLYHLLLSSGTFAIYRSESQAYSRFGPIFGPLVSEKGRGNFLDAWLRSEFFLRSGLDPATFRQSVVSEVRSPGDFLHLLMESICAQQEATRWAECTPDHGLYIKEIKRDFPDALFIHVIRDGRDVALSLAEKAFVVPLRWGRYASESAAAVYWSWISRRISRLVKYAAGDVLTIRYEDLIGSFDKTLASIAQFIDKPICLESIAENPIGSVVQPNSSFGDEQDTSAMGVERWRQRCNPELLKVLEEYIAPQLSEFGYQPLNAIQKISFIARLRRTIHVLRFETGYFLRRYGISRQVTVEDWSNAASNLASKDPTLRPGDNLPTIRNLIHRNKT